LNLSFGTITIFILLCTVALFIWFFRAKDEDYTEQKNILFEEGENNISEEGKHE